jgi:SNF2 family DNA or RNA helicase
MPQQQRALDLSVEARFFYLAMEQRTGKTKVVIDNTARCFIDGIIDSLLVLAGGGTGVAANWEDEVEAHLLEAIPRRVLVWRASRAKTKTFREALDALLAFEGIAVLAVNSEAMIGEPFRAYLRGFLARRRAFLAADEAGFMKAPGSSASRVARAISRHKNVIFKRALDGTPGERPLDLWAQWDFLDPSVLECPTFGVFKARYAEWEDKVAYSTGQRYQVLKRYKNLDDLQRRIAPYTFRCLRSDLSDAPPKTYETWHVDLTERQRAVYDRLAEEFVAETTQGTISAPLAIVRLTRLQQILSNFLPTDPTAEACPTCEGYGKYPLDEDPCPTCEGYGFVEREGVVHAVDDRNDPRLERLVEGVAAHDGPAIVWSRFTRDLARAGEHLARQGLSVARYDGTVSAAKKIEVKADFAAGRVRVLLANQRAAARGVKFRLEGGSAVHLHVYYANSFSLLARQQSEDRTEVVGDPLSTRVADIVARGTVDEKIVLAHREKRDVMRAVLGDRS